MRWAFEDSFGDRIYFTTMDGETYLVESPVGQACEFGRRELVGMCVALLHRAAPDLLCDIPFKYLVGGAEFKISFEGDDDIFVKLSEPVGDYNTMTKSSGELVSTHPNASCLLVNLHD